MVDEYRLAQMIQAARRKAGMTQTEVSKKTKITQGTLSKIEAHVCSVSAKHWFLLSELLNIPHHSAIAGILDRGDKVKKILRNNSFRLPARYTKAALGSVKEILPFVEVVKELKGKSKFEEFSKKVRVDELYFYDLTNPLSFLYIKDLLGFYQLEEQKDELFVQAGRKASDPWYHGFYGTELFKKTKKPLSFLKGLLELSPFYQQSDKYTVTFKDQNALHFLASPTKYHKEYLSLINPQAIELGDYYRPRYWKGLVEAACHCNISIEKVSEDRQGQSYKATILP